MGLHTAAVRLVFIGELFFPEFPKFGNNWRLVSRYGGVLSLYIREILQKKEKTGLLNFTYICGKKSRKIWKMKKLREKNMEIKQTETNMDGRLTGGYNVLLGSPPWDLSTTWCQFVPNYKHHFI